MTKITSAGFWSSFGLLFELGFVLNNPKLGRGVWMNLIMIGFALMAKIIPYSACIVEIHWGG